MFKYSSKYFAAFFNKHGVLSLDVCKHKSTNRECAKLPLEDGPSFFQQWRHYCTTFQVERTSGDNYTSTVTTYEDGKAKIQG